MEAPEPSRRAWDRGAWLGLLRLELMIQVGVTTNWLAGTFEVLEITAA